MKASNIKYIFAFAIAMMLVFSGFLLVANNPTSSLGAQFVLAGGGGGGGGGGGAGDACGPSGSGDTSGMSGGCGCDGSAGVGGGDGGGDDGHGGGPVCTTFSCISAANICGDINTGTQNSCTNVCSASVPANPSGSCSIATVCGVNATGFNGCSGSCNITRYPFCKTVQNPGGDGEIEWITLGGGGDGDGLGFGATDIAAEIFAKPNLVAQDTPTVIRWISIETDSCTITGTNGDEWSGKIGEELSGDIAERTTFTIECIGYDGSIVTDSVQVNIVPIWEEF